MSARIAILISPATPPYWLKAVVDAIESSTAFDRNVRIVEYSPSSEQDSGIRASKAVHFVLLVDRAIRSTRPQRATGREHPVFSPPTRPVSISRLAFRDERIGGKNQAIADIGVALSSSPPEASVTSRFTFGVLHATRAGTGLGANDLSFVCAVANAEQTVDVVISLHGGEGTTGTTVMTSRSSTRSVSPTLNDEMLAARIGDLLILQCEKHLGGRRNQSIYADGESLAASSQTKEDHKLGTSVAANLAKRRITGALSDRRSKSKWSLAYRRSSGDSLSDCIAKIPESESLVAPAGISWADPFPVHSQGCDLVFFEQEVRGEGYGHIVVAELLPDGRLTAPQRVLDTGTHLSYPHVFLHAGDWYMIPESRSAGTVTLYRASDFPNRWEKVCDLVTGSRIADATVFEYQGLWWMFGCRVGAGGSTFEDLVLFQASSLTGQWRPHPGNPVVSDATGGRPAGKIIFEDSHLIRPAQNCSVRYGYGLSFQSVSRLTTTEYLEDRVAVRDPDWDSGLFGTHTFNRSSTMTFVDLLRKESP